MTITGPSQLAEILRAAANAHDVHEHSLGLPDSDWPTRYARYIFDTKNSEASSPRLQHASGRPPELSSIRPNFPG